MRLFNIEKIRTFRLTDRRRLVASTLLLQGIVLALGVTLGFGAIRGAVSAHVREEALDEIARTARQAAARLASSIDTRPDVGTEAWRTAQTMVDSLRLPNGAFVSILDTENRLLCQPGVQDPSASERVDLSELPFTLRPSGEIVPLGSLFPRGVVVGSGEILGAASDAAVLYRPDIPAKVLVVQPRALLEAAAGRVVGRLLLIVLGCAALVLMLTGAGEALLIRRYDSMLMRINRELEAEVRRKVKDGLRIRNALIFGLAKLADYRDTDTGKHLERICRYCELLANHLRAVFPEIDDAWIERLKLASSLHDIGKVGIPDSILLKPGAFTPEERRHMEQHTLIGADTLVAIRRQLGEDELLNMGVAVAIQHHERWDGSGYPMGLAGEEIELSARIVALADVYDALTSRRVYKIAKSHEEARELILNSRGTHLDPRVVDGFEQIHTQFEATRRELQPDTCEPDKPMLMRALERVEEAQRQAKAA